MRQRVNDATVYGKKRVKLIGRLDALCFCKQHKPFWVAFEVEISICSKVTIFEPTRWLFTPVYESEYFEPNFWILAIVTDSLGMRPATIEPTSIFSFWSVIVVGTNQLFIVIEGHKESAPAVHIPKLRRPYHSYLAKRNIHKRIRPYRRTFSVRDLLCNCRLSLVGTFEL